MEDQIVISQTESVESNIQTASKQESLDCISLENLNEIIPKLLQLGEEVFVVEQIVRESGIQNRRIKDIQDRILGYSRKEKSLQQLSRKFMESFQGNPDNLLELDKTTLKLGVERRRMYDIINILESLNVVTKIGKNKYLWKGLTQAVKTIRICQVDTQFYRLNSKKKQKSLEFLAWSFLNLFIHRRPAISLQQATKTLLTNVQQNMVRTKIRRLYDIVNVFKSLGFVRKVQLPNRKPGFQWVGTKKLESFITEKRRFQNSPPKLQDRNETDTRQSNTLQRSPSFPYVQKHTESITSLEPIQFQNNYSRKNLQSYLEEKSIHNQIRYQALGGLTKFYKGRSAFQMVKRQNL